MHLRQGDIKIHFESMAIVIVVFHIMEGDVEVIVFSFFNLLYFQGSSTPASLWSVIALGCWLKDCLSI